MRFLGQLARLTVKVLEVRELYPLPHAQNVACGAEAIEKHPDVSSIERRDLLARLATRRSPPVRLKRMLDIRPRRNDTAKHHQAKAEQSHAGHAAAEPEHLAISDQDDCQVLEDGVDGDAEELERFAAGVDHADEEERDGEPFSGFVGVEVAEAGEAKELEGLDCHDADDALREPWMSAHVYCCLTKGTLFNPPARPTGKSSD